MVVSRLGMNVHVRSRNSMPFNSLQGDGHFVADDRCNRSADLLYGCTGVHQGGHEHVPGCAS